MRYFSLAFFLALISLSPNSVRCELPLSLGRPCRIEFDANISGFYGPRFGGGRGSVFCDFEEYSRPVRIYINSLGPRQGNWPSFRAEITGLSALTLAKGAVIPLRVRGNPTFGDNSFAMEISRTTPARNAGGDLQSFERATLTILQILEGEKEENAQHLPLLSVSFSEAIRDSSWILILDPVHP